jgi:hypothetical protein
MTTSGANARGFDRCGTDAPLAAQQPKGVANLTLRLGGESVVAGERQQQDEPDGSSVGGNGWNDADRVHDV